MSLMNSILQSFDIRGQIDQTLAEGLNAEAGLLDEALTETIAEQTAALTSSGPAEQNLMAGNFFDYDYQQSKYLTSQVQTLHVASQLQTTQQSQAYCLLERFGGLKASGTFSGGAYGPDEAGSGTSKDDIEEALQGDVDQRIIDDSQEDFEQRQAAEEAQAQAAVDGAAQDAAVEATGQAVVATDAEVAADQQDAAPQAQATTEPAADAAPQALVHANAAHPSIDVIV
ncbi:hypothetical protein [Desulfarculus baarsii]|nr:hypothetical protein [Desulfarculus baarsii]